MWHALASSVKCPQLEHLNKQAQPKKFNVEPKTFKVGARLPKSKHLMASKKKGDRFTLSMEMKQLPVISNTATTDHKLQGVGVDNLLVSEWCNEASWIYVILSRVTTREGLFLRKELTPDIDLHRVPKLLKKKLDHFRKNCVREELSDADYETMSAP